MRTYLDRYEKMTQTIWWLQTIERRFAIDQKWLVNFSEMETLRDVLNQYIEQYAELVVYIAFQDLSTEDKLQVLDHVTIDSDKHYELTKAFFEDERILNSEDAEVVLENFKLKLLRKSLEETNIAYNEDLNSQKYFVTYVSNTVQLLEDIIKEHQYRVDEIEKETPNADFTNENAIIETSDMIRHFLTTIFELTYDEKLFS